MSGSVSGLSASVLYPVVSKNEQANVTKFEGWDPQTKAAIAYFQKQAPKLTTPAALLKDYRSLQVVLNAFGMGSYISDTALLKQLMTQDPTSASSLAYRSANPTWQRFAKYMSDWSTPPLSNAATVAVVTGQYATNAYEAAEGQQSPGLQEALYFRRTAGSVTSIQGLMSDPTLLKVVEGALGLPQQFGLLDYDQQVKLLSRQVDVKKFSDPAWVDRTAQKYLALSQASAGGLGSPLTGVAAVFNQASGNELLGTLFSGSGATTGSGTSVLGALFNTSA